ncbi:transketolase [Azotosporobacter soli]|uniref:transketolase n=1 Tax=Azotosporobacter soli TaxID=3055040 RepID=UPI0031FF3E4F
MEKREQSVAQIAVNTIRTLAIDAIEQAESGHPGMPLGAAPMAYQLWTRHMKHNPTNPNWFNRDRFVLSAGHGSMLLYALLHLSGYELSMEDLKQFRQWQSRTPGHPEYGHTKGVDATTGPLGQGIAMAVGMAMAERHLAARFNRDGYPVIEHRTYSLCGDGDLMEGVAAEAASLAGHLKLGRLIVLYDSNDISLDGDLAKSFSENVAQRFAAYGWQVLRVEDGNDLAAIDAALASAEEEDARPSLIEVKTVIGYGAPKKAGTSAAHGSPLGKDEAAGAKQAYAWQETQPFTVPAGIYEHFETAVKERGCQAEEEWRALLVRYHAAYPELGSVLAQAMSGKLPENWQAALPVFAKGASLATRSASGEIINALAQVLPCFFGGSADLAGSNKTTIKGGGDFSALQPTGRNIWFGVREFAMGAALNGAALHGGLSVFGATFFVFADYLRPAIRLAALMKLPVTYVFTHDSIAVGEDGPTHEPIEQLASLRAMPNLHVIRPADANETAAAWRIALQASATPTALVLSRQDLPVLPATDKLAKEGVVRGAYVLSPGKGGSLRGLILASGSEVALALEAQAKLAEEHIYVSVISFPCWSLFEKQGREYKDSVLLPQISARLALEMGASMGWERYVGERGRVLAIDAFGASAPGEELIRRYGFNVKNVVERMKQLLAENR